MDNILFAIIMSLAGGLGMLAGLSLAGADRWPAWRNVLAAVLAMPIVFAIAFFAFDGEAEAPQYAIVLTGAQVSPEVEGALRTALQGDGRMTWGEYRSIVTVQGAPSREEMRAIAQRVVAPVKPAAR